MSWEKVKLGDVAEFSNGVNFGKEAYGKGIKLIGVSDFGDRFYPDYTSLGEVKKDVVRKNDYLKNDDIIFVRSNGNKELVGRCMLVRNPSDQVTFSGFCIRARLKDRKHQNPVYWTYHFKCDMFRKAMSGTANGANIQNLSQGRLAIYEARIPDIEIQNRIASILSAYDELIETNQRQIKLLEEAAQRLYKEWFVDLHFPGWENTQIVDGVPEGWRVRTIEDISCVLRRGISPKYNEKAKYMVINQKCIRKAVMDMSEARCQEKMYPDELNIKDGDVVICSTGIGTLGRVGQVYGDYPHTTFDSHVTLVRARTEVQFLYHSIKNNQTYLMGCGKGSTNQQELSRDVIKAVKILVPDSKSLSTFEKYAQAIHDKIRILRDQALLATEARNRVLPKLMNGEIDL